MTGPSRGTTIQTTGKASIGSIASLTNKVITISLKRAFADTAYEAYAWVVGDVALLGSVGIVPGSIVIVNEWQVQATVRNSSLVTVNSGEVYVMAEKN